MEATVLITKAFGEKMRIITTIFIMLCSFSATLHASTESVSSSTQSHTGTLQAIDMEAAKLTIDNSDYVMANSLSVLDSMEALIGRRALIVGQEIEFFTDASQLVYKIKIRSPLQPSTEH